MSDEIWVLEWHSDHEEYDSDSDLAGLFDTEYLAKQALPADLEWHSPSESQPRYQVARFSSPEGEFRLSPMIRNKLFIWE